MVEAVELVEKKRRRQDDGQEQEHAEESFQVDCAILTLASQSIIGKRPDPVRIVQEIVFRHRRTRPPTKECHSVL